jgi:hypothetical protein
MKGLIVINTINVYVQVSDDGGTRNSRNSMKIPYLKTGEFNAALAKTILWCIEEQGVQDFTIIDARML